MALQLVSIVAPALTYYGPAACFNRNPGPLLLLAVTRIMELFLLHSLVPTILAGTLLQEGAAEASRRKAEEVSHM